MALGYLFINCSWSLHGRHVAPSDDLEMPHGRITQNRMHACIRVDTYVDTLTYFKSLKIPFTGSLG